jgi:hypothetical protein
MVPAVQAGGIGRVVRTAGGKTRGQVRVGEEQGSEGDQVRRTVVDQVQRIRAGVRWNGVWVEDEGAGPLLAQPVRERAVGALHEMQVAQLEWDQPREQSEVRRLRIVLRDAVVRAPG